MQQTKPNEESKQGGQLAFLLDLDGTLVDSVYRHVLAWQEALRKSGLDLPGSAHSSACRYEWRIARAARCCGRAARDEEKEVSRSRNNTAKRIRDWSAM